MFGENLPKPMIWAHRGRNRAAPENTMAAFRAAFAAGDRGIELDITLSLDGALVVIHDDRVDRTTDGTGAVAQMTAAQLRGLDAGSWFSAEFARERLPILREVLTEAGQSSAGTVVNIEIKSTAWNEVSSKSIEAPLIRLLAETDMMDSVLISSFHWKSLQAVRELDARLPLGVLADTGADPGIVAEEASRLSAFSIHPSVSDILNGMPAPYRNFPGRIYPYTVQTARMAHMVRNAGADGFFADLPF